MKHIAITIDKNYVVPAAVMLHSLLLNNNPKDVHIHVILNFDSYTYKIPIIYILKKHKCKYSFYLIRDEDIHFAKDLVISHHVTLATYYRLFLHTILNDLDAVLFLDSDLIVDGSLDGLFINNLTNYSAAAVFYNNEERINKLNLLHGYFNAGVMHLNLAYFRQHNYTHRFTAFIEKNAEKILFWDQDVLNSVLEGTVMQLNKKWNYISINIDENDKTIKPVIIHFTGTHKPWGKHGCPHKISYKYFEYLNKDIGLRIINKVFNLYALIIYKLSI